MTFNEAGITLNIKTIDIACPDSQDEHASDSHDEHASDSNDEHGTSHDSASGGHGDSHNEFPIWDYSQNGADWPDRFPNCAEPIQSPINLLDPITAYG
jgi:hypothetical protein